MIVNLDSTKALVFRIVHKGNIPSILDRGILCRSSTNDAKYIDIGNLDLIDKRKTRNVPIYPFGTLSDYIPFYFTYASPMLYCIKKGYGVPRQQDSDIVFFVTSLHHLKKYQIKFLFTDRHAFLATAEFFDDLNHLTRIDWNILQQKNFERDPEDPGKKERYMAEALVHKALPLSGLMGIVCYNEQVASATREGIASKKLEVPVFVRPNWYFQ